MSFISVTVYGVYRYAALLYAYGRPRTATDREHGGDWAHNTQSMIRDTDRTHMTREPTRLDTLTPCVTDGQKVKGEL